MYNFFLLPVPRGSKKQPFKNSDKLPIYSKQVAAYTYSKLAIEALEQGVKNVQS